MEKEWNSQQRILEIWKRLMDGETLDIKLLKEEFGKSEATFKRDIKYIREVVQELGKDVLYCNHENEYKYISSNAATGLSVQDAIVMLILIYRSRAFNKEELKLLKDKFENMFSWEQGVKIRNFFQGFNTYYEPIQQSTVMDQIYDIYLAVTNKRVLEFIYTNQTGSKVRKVIPFTVTFQDGYFYLAATISDKRYKTPVYWRLDRMKDLRVLNEKITFTKGTPFFETGNFLSKTFNMFVNEQVTVRLKMKNSIKEYLLQKASSIKIIENDPEVEWMVVETTVYGEKGMILWILSQGEDVEVLAPQTLRSEIIGKIEKMKNNYFSIPL